MDLYIRNVINNNEQLWDIPVTYTTKKEQNFELSGCQSFLMEQRRDGINTNLADDEWIILNLQYTGENTTCSIYHNFIIFDIVLLYVNYLILITVFMSK